MSIYFTGQFNEAIKVLTEQQIMSPNSRAALSLLGYCYFFKQDFSNAANCYEQLIQLFPDIDEYKIYYAQSLYQACSYDSAMKAAFQIDEKSRYRNQILKLQVFYN